MTALFDHRQVRRAFSRAAHGYDSAAALQREVDSRLMESLDYLDDPARARPAPEVVVDLGCGPGHSSAALQKRWPQGRALWGAAVVIVGIVVFSWIAARAAAGDHRATQDLRSDRGA